MGTEERKPVDALSTIYNHNPFYAISACLVLYGLYALFKSSDASKSSWALLGALAGYTALMALAGVAIVRLGRVWEDARSIVIIVVLLCLTLSASFDDIIINAPGTGALLLVWGFLFSVVISEGLARGLRLTVPALVRVPYYALLALFFAYPRLLWYLLRVYEADGRDVVRWGMLAFPAASGFLFLLLLPAARRGIAYVRDNGTPWQWPWFPWGLFVALAFGVCARTYIFTWSFDPIPGMKETIFGGYFLAPFFLALGLLMMEIGHGGGNKRIQHAGLALPAAAFFLSLHQPVVQGMAGYVALMLGPPEVLTAIGAVAACLYGFMRGIAWSEAGVAGGLLVLGFLPGETSAITLTPRLMLLAAVVLFELCLALTRGTPWRGFCAVLVVLAAATMGLRGTWFTAWDGAIPAHMAYAVILLFGALFRDRFSRPLQDVGAALMFCAILLVGLLGIAPAGLEWARPFYLMGIIVVAFGYWRLVGNRYYLYAGFAALGLFALRLLAIIYLFLTRPDRPRGVLPLVAGGIAFGVGAAISLSKGGFFRRLRGHARREHTQGIYP